jgi:hypothetical protein
MVGVSAFASYLKTQLTLIISLRFTFTKTLNTLRATFRPAYTPAYTSANPPPATAFSLSLFTPFRMKLVGSVPVCLAIVLIQRWHNLESTAEVSLVPETYMKEYLMKFMASFGETGALTFSRRDIKTIRSSSIQSSQVISFTLDIQTLSACKTGVELDTADARGYMPLRSSNARQTQEHRARQLQ